jgi:hypothetical protein
VLLDVFRARGSEDIREVLMHQMFGDTTLAMRPELRAGRGHVRIGDRPPALPLVAVGRSGADMPVSNAQRGTDRLLGLRRGDLQDSEPHGGD